MIRSGLTASKSASASPTEKAEYTSYPSFLILTISPGSGSGHPPKARSSASRPDSFTAVFIVHCTTGVFFASTRRLPGFSKDLLRILHHNTLYRVSHMLTGVCTALQIDINLSPGNDVERIAALCVKSSHTAHKEPVRCFLQVIDLMIRFSVPWNDGNPKMPSEDHGPFRSTGSPRLSSPAHHPRSPVHCSYRCASAHPPPYPS